MKRGYFDDFKDLKDTQGRMFEPSGALSFASSSPQLPTIAVRPAPPLFSVLPVCMHLVSSLHLTVTQNCESWR